MDKLSRRQLFDRLKPNYFFRMARRKAFDKTGRKRYFYYENYFVGNYKGYV